MAIIYTPQGGDEYTLGGQMTQPAFGVAGPFPRYTISKEVLRKDSIVIGQKFSITVTGVALITASASMTSKGVRQNEIQNLINLLISADAVIGSLEITPYGGLANKIQFDDARLLSVEAQEQDDASSGVQNQPYTFTFEAYRDKKNGDTDDTMLGILDFSESWDVAVNDGQYGTADGDDFGDTDDIYRTFSITHSINATGYDFYGGTSTIEMAWEKAQTFVESRLSNDPITTVPKDMNALNHAQNYPKGTGTDVNLHIPDGYTAYNLVRERSKDIAGGGYSVTETWLAGKFAATSTVEVSAELSEDAEFNTINLSLTVQGMETLNGTIGADSKYDANSEGKYSNAQTLANAINLSTIATNFYNKNKASWGEEDGSLRSIEKTRSETHNAMDGTISISVSYDDQVICDENVISETINLTYNNDDGGNEIVALQQIIGRPDGPIIQDMSTTNERTFSISIEKVMKKSARGSKPDASDLVAQYKPTIAGGHGPFRTSKTESWNPKSGAYSLSEDYVYGQASTIYTGEPDCT